MNTLVLKTLYWFMSIPKLDYKVYVYSLVGFLMGAVANNFAEVYGVYVGLSLFMGGWWLILYALTKAQKIGGK